ncbi:hypothetical protein OAB29_06875 [Oceanospirillaceae bacterium]|nr:hypothetical protein [Oceanospirillaceae bacterium]MDC1341823.1 hypothetical protein [Oceanospirillaceae bacterium]
MKKQLVLLFSIFFFSSASIFADVLYCSSDDATGFVVKESYKRSAFKTNRFKLKVDFENKSMSSADIFMQGVVECVGDNTTMYCLSGYGTSFALNRKTLKFHYSIIYLKEENQRDSITLHHGKCEKF